VTDKPVAVVEETDEDTIPAKDPETGRFLTGNKIGGRVKGSRNRITKLRLEIEEASRLLLRSEAENLLTTAINMAKDGDSIIMKALLDKFMTTPKDDEEANKRPDAVKVIVVTSQAESPPKVTVSTRDPVTIDQES
jgi:hypothetical protein